jgi:hypothetical protein
MTNFLQNLYRNKFDLEDHLEHVKSFNLEDPEECDDLLDAMDRLAGFLSNIEGIGR